MHFASMVRIISNGRLLTEIHHKGNLTYWINHYKSYMYFEDFHRYNMTLGEDGTLGVDGATNSQSTKFFRFLLYIFLDITLEQNVVIYLRYLFMGHFIKKYYIFMTNTYYSFTKITVEPIFSLC